MIENHQWTCTNKCYHLFIENDALQLNKIMFCIGFSCECINCSLILFKKSLKLQTKFAMM
jgi:hypothetical protein